MLFLLPDNRTPTSVASAIVGMAPGQPGWFSHFLTSLGNQFSTTGTQTAWVLAAVSVVIGLGPLVARRPGWILGAGALFAGALWIAGQGLVGNLFTGPVTDPNTGRARRRSRRRPTPASRTRSASGSPGSTWPTRPTWS